MARISVGPRLHELSSGTRDDAHAWADDIGVDRFTQEFRVQGGRLRVGETTTRDPDTGLRDPVMAVIWEGKSHAVYTHLYHGRPADAVALFQTVRVAEHDDGIVATPHGRAASPEPADLVKEVPGLGLLEIKALTARTRRVLPPWRGAKVAGGELFQDQVEGQGPYFLLALKSLLVTVLPEEELVRETPRTLSTLAIEAVR